MAKKTDKPTDDQPSDQAKGLAEEEPIAQPEPGPETEPASDANQATEGADAPVFDAEGEIDPSREQHGINPQKIVSGTTGRKVGPLSEELMPGVDPVEANAALIPDGSKPQVTDLEVAGIEVPESRPAPGGDSVPDAPKPKKGYVQVRGLKENAPFSSEGGPIAKGQVVNVPEDEAEILVANGDVERA